MTAQTGDTSPVSIRKATATDAEGILACLQSAFEPFKAQYTPAAYDDTVLNVSRFHQRLLKMAVFVAMCKSGKVIGTIACEALNNEEGHLRGMAVLPAWQGRGISQQLLNRAESELRERGCTLITLDTTKPLNRAVRFYERNGFRATGRVTNFFAMPLFEYAKRL
jgi:ribosomal protein S18 acetylase RimI-like enzyme